MNHKLTNPILIGQYSEQFTNIINDNFIKMQRHMPLILTTSQRTNLDQSLKTNKRLVFDTDEGKWYSWELVMGSYSWKPINFIRNAFLPSLVQKQGMTILEEDTNSVSYTSLLSGYEYNPATNFMLVVLDGTVLTEHDQYSIDPPSRSILANGLWRKGQQLMVIVLGLEADEEDVDFSEFLERLDQLEQQVQRIEDTEAGSNISEIVEQTFYVVVDTTKAIEQSMLDIDDDTRAYYMSADTSKESREMNYYKWKKLRDVVSRIADTGIYRFRILGDGKKINAYIEHTNNQYQFDINRFYGCSVENFFSVHNGELRNEIVMDNINISFRAEKLDQSAQIQLLGLSLFNWKKAVVENCIIDIEGEGVQNGIFVASNDINLKPKPDHEDNKIYGFPTSIIRNNIINLSTDYDKNNYTQHGIRVSGGYYVVIENNDVTINKHTTPIRGATEGIFVHMCLGSTRIISNEIKGNLYRGIAINGVQNIPAYEITVEIYGAYEVMHNRVKGNFSREGIYINTSNAHIHSNDVWKLNPNKEYSALEESNMIQVGSDSATYAQDSIIRINDNILTASKNQNIEDLILINNLKDVILDNNKYLNIYDREDLIGIYLNKEEFPTTPQSNFVGKAILNAEDKKIFTWDNSSKKWVMGESTILTNNYIDIPSGMIGLLNGGSYKKGGEIIAPEDVAYYNYAAEIFAKNGRSEYFEQAWEDQDRFTVVDGEVVGFDGVGQVQDIIVPQGVEILDYDIVSVGNIYTMVFPKGIDKINYQGSGTFTAKYVDLPESLREIGWTFLASFKGTKITIPENVEVVEGGAFLLSSLETIIFKPLTPPSITSITFAEIYTDYTIYVPDQSLRLYKQATNWVDVKDRIKPISELYGLQETYATKEYVGNLIIGSLGSDY